MYFEGPQQRGQTAKFNSFLRIAFESNLHPLGCLYSTKASFCPPGFSAKDENYLLATYGFLIGIYLFCENWSTETYRKRPKEVGWLLHLVSLL